MSSTGNIVPVKKGKPQVVVSTFEKYSRVNNVQTIVLRYAVIASFSTALSSVLFTVETKIPYLVLLTDTNPH